MGQNVFVSVLTGSRIASVFPRFSRRVKNRLPIKLARSSFALIPLTIEQAQRSMA
jgi:hypothetical protein